MRHTIIIFAALAGAWQAEAQHSVLADSYWVKARITHGGIHAISAQQAQQWRLGNITQISVWSGTGSMLEHNNNPAFPQDLQQLPTTILGDRLLFYAPATTRWKYEHDQDFYSHELNQFSSYSYIYITNSQSPVRINLQPSMQATQNSNAYDFLTMYEREDTNLLRSGRRFFSDFFDNKEQRTFTFHIPSIIGNVISIKVAAAAKSSGADGTLFAYINGANPHSISIRSIDEDEAAVDGTIFVRNAPCAAGNVSIRVAYSSAAQGCIAMLDYITLNARSMLAMNNEQIVFSDKESVHEGAITRFTISTTRTDAQVWDVSDIFNIKAMTIVQGAGSISFDSPTDTLKTFAAFAPSMVHTPQFAGIVPNQDLLGMRAAQYVIVTPAMFALMAQRLADLYNNQRHVPTNWVTTEQIYNEFSAGIPDPAAIRNYFRALREHGMLPQYALLFGGGSYINMAGRHGAGIIPTYQSEESLAQKYSFVSDDYFALLDPGETLGRDGMHGELDIAIGRLPVENTSEASVIVHKIERHYAQAAAHGSSQFVMIADDGDGNMHAEQTEDLCRFMQDTQPAYALNKIYFDKYPQTTNATGRHYPAVTEAIASAVNGGALVVNYVGHANTQWLSHEQVLTQADIAKWRSDAGMPLFITATCEFSRFDTHYQRSAGVNVLLKASGGGIAMLSTTRLVYSQGNAALNKEFMRQLFQRDANGMPLPLGEVLRRTKNNIRSSVNHLNFMLLGDPALVLNLHSDSLNSIKLLVDGIPTDTLRAWSRVHITGKAHGCSNGDTITIAAYDKSEQKQTLGNGGQQPFTYSEHALLYRGMALFDADSFTASFVVPQDIGLMYGLGKITYYGKCRSRWLGGALPVVVGGVGGMACQGAAPHAALYIDDEEFVDGAMTTQLPMFIAVLNDENGINLTGSGIGRSMTLHLQEMGRKYDVSAYYAADGSGRGVVRFPLPPLPLGEHTAVFKAWNVCNVSVQSSIRFVVVAEPKFVVNALYNFPNPFGGSTWFYFTHNRMDAQMHVQIEIYSMNGALQRVLEYIIYGADTQRDNNFARWDGRDAAGMPCAAGIYVYRLRLRTQEGEHTTKTGKLLYLCPK